MRLSWIEGSLAVCTAAGMVATVLAQEYVQDYNEDKVDLAKVPPTVRQKADAAAKGVNFDRAFQDNNKFYRLVGKKADGALVVVYTDDDGALFSVTTRTPAKADDVPKAVAKAFDAERRKNRQLKGFKPTSIDRAEVFHAVKKETEHLYQYRGRNGENLRCEVEIQDDGKVKQAGIVLVHPDANRQEQKLEQLPPEVAQAVAQGLPGVRITGASEQKSTGGIASIVLTGRDEQGHKVEADVTPNGSITTVKTGLAAGEVPREAFDLLRQKIPQNDQLAGFRPSKYQRLELRQFPGGGALVFVFLGKNGKGQPYEVRVFADGSETMVLAASEKDLEPDAKEGNGAPTKGKAKGGGKKGRGKKRGR